MATGAAKRTKSAIRKRRDATRRKPDAVAAALAIFAHEVRTPLTGILAAADLLAASSLGDEERRWLQTIKAASEHLAALATLFVDGARPSSMPLREEVIDLPVFAQSLADALTVRAAGKGLQASVRIGRLPPRVSGDAVRLRAALENLIDNAVKFTERGMVALTVSAKRRKSDVTLRVTLKDSGVGLSAAEAKRLFRPFAQANAGVAARFGGAGLGLASARKIMRAMGGDIVAAPRARGASFTATAALALADAPAGAAPGGAGLRVLCVEDNPFGRVVLKAMLTGLGHTAEFAGSGEEALARLETEPFDAVLMDMVLPGIGGVEAIRRIRSLKRRGASITIVGLSGLDRDAGAARQAGADAFLVKPAAPRALAAALRGARRPRAGATS